MSRDEANALLAIKNTWLGTVTSARTLEEALRTVDALPAETPLAELDLEGWKRLASAHATASLALQGLIEDLERVRARDA